MLPRGWALHDQRDAPEVDTPTVEPFGDAATEPAEPAAIEAHPPIDMEIELDEAVGAIAGARTVRGRRPHRSRRPESVPAPAIGPVADREDLTSLLDAQTPLLRRAFGNVQLDD